MNSDGEPADAAGQFIIDQPASKDFFQTHSSLVRAILDTIKSDKRIRTIGLLGRWGIGKSTVVQTLERSVSTETPTEHVFFNYDAWVHQGDPARRSFLEQLISHVVAEQATDRVDWGKSLRQLAGQLEYSTGQRIPHLSGLAKILILSVLPVPFIYSLVDSQLLEKVFADSPDPLSRYILLIAILVTVLPAVIILVAYLATRPWSAWRDKAKKVWTAPPDVLSLVISRTAERTSTTTLRQTEPTAIEFQRLFIEVLSSLRGKRLIVVIDNLDRLDASEALSIWSVMISFFTNHPTGDSAPPLPLVILPIDAQSLMDLLGEREESNKISSEALIEKTFDVVFELPQPVLSDWREFLSAQARIAFGPNIDADAIYYLTRHFEEFVSNEPVKDITPRRINRFLNRVRALRMQQCQEFPVSAVALYVANNRKISSGLFAFLAKYPAPPDYPADWQTIVSAIHFGVRLDKASQVSLGEPLNLAVRERDIDKFISLSKISGFNHVFERFAANPPSVGEAGVDASQVLNAAYLANEAINRGAPIATEVTWSRFAAALSGASVRTIQAEQYSAGLAAIIQHVSTDWLERLYRGQALQFVSIVGQTTEPADLNGLVGVYSRLAKAAGVMPGKSKVFATSENIGVALRLLAAAYSEPVITQNITSAASWYDVGAYLTDMLRDRDLATQVPKMMDVLRAGDASKIFGGAPELGYKPLAGAVVTLIEDPDTERDQLAAAARVLGTPGEAREHFLTVAETLEDDSDFHEHISAALSGEQWDVASALVALSISFDVSLPDSIGDSVIAALSSDGFTVALIQDLRRMNESCFICPFVELKKSSNTLFKIFWPLLNRMLNKGDIGDRVPVEWVLQNASEFLEGIEPQLRRKFARSLSTFQTFADKLIGLSSTATFIKVVRLLPTEEANKLAVRRLNNLSADDWRSAVLGAGPNWLLIAGYGSHLDAALGSRSDAFAGIKAAASLLLDAPSDSAINRLKSCLAALSKKARSGLLSEILQAVVEKPAAQFLVQLSKDGYFNEELRRLMKPEALSKDLIASLCRIGGGRTWIERNSAWLSKMPKSVKEEMIKRFEGQSKDRRSKVRDSARHLLTVFKPE